MGLMAHCSTLMGQLLQLIPRHVFEHLVDSHAWQGPKPRKFTYWSHLGAMLFGQWSARKSLRDLVFSVNRHVRKCYHLGLTAVKRSTLADANQQRPAVIFEKTYYKLYERLSAELITQPQEAPEIKIIDSTTIDLCASVFPWAKFRTRKGAIKLHTVLTGMLPQCVLVTDGKTHDRRAVQDLHFEPDDLLIFDRAYLDYVWLYRLHQGGVWFVTRLKTNSCYEVIQSRAASSPVLADQIIRLSSPQGQTCYPELLRRVHYRDPETGQEYVFLTNRRDLPALEVAELYRRRWQIELFFKWIKQNLQIKAFYGTSKNAVLIQIWTALIAYLLLVWLKFKSKVGWGLLELTRLAQTMLLERSELWALLGLRPPDNRQPLLFNLRAGQ
jgi:IS4 transposase